MLVESHILDRLTANATAEKHIYYGVSCSRSFPHLTAVMLERYLTTGREHGSTAMLQTVKSEMPRKSDG